MDANPVTSPMRGKYLYRKIFPFLFLTGIDLLYSSVRKNFRLKKIPRMPDRILLANGAHLGDILLATSVLPILKEVYPKVKIGFVVGSWAYKAIENHPLLDWVHIVDHWKLNRSSDPLLKKYQHYKTTLNKALNEIKMRNYDIGIDLYHLFPNFIHLLWTAKIPIRLGYTSAGFGPLLTHSQDWKYQNRSIPDYHFALLKGLPGFDRNREQDNMGYSLPFIPDLDQQILAKHFRDKNDPRYLILHLGTGLRIKEWPLMNWRSLAQQLVQSGHSLLFTGAGERENKQIEEVISGIPNCINLCNQLDWKQFCSVIKNARLVFCCDTSAAHISAACETPCVVIGHGLNNIYHWRPMSSKSVVLYHPVSCVPCYKSDGCGTMECIKKIEVNEVYKAGLNSWEGEYQY